MIGNGNQGSKHRLALGGNCVGVVDELSTDAGITALSNFSTENYDAVVIATPEQVKNFYIEYALGRKKSVLVEKPIEIDAKLARLIEDSLQRNLSFETAYDHQFDPGIMLLIERVKALAPSQLKWTNLKMNYSFGTEALVQGSDWMDFGTGPWELVAPHVLRILCDIDQDSSEDFEFSFGMGNLNSPSTVTGVRSGQHYAEITTSYTSWLNSFSINFTWEEGNYELSGLTKWGESIFTGYKRIHPAGKPTIIERQVFSPRTPIEAVATLHHNVFSGDLSYALACDEKIAQYLVRARQQLKVWNDTP